MPQAPQYTQTSRQHWVPLFIAVCLVAVNLRLSITSVGPMLNAIATDQGVSPATLGLLSSVPLLVWATFSPLAHWLAVRIGLNQAVSWSLVLLFVATLWRSLPGSPLNLWLGTALIGIALAVANVLLPATIKRDFGSRVPLVMGVYSALIGLSGALGAGMVAPIAQLNVDGAELGWRWALVATAALIPAALLWWMLTTRGQQRVAQQGGKAAATADQNSGLRVWRDPVAWQMALYMGSQSWTFYIYASWLASIDISRGTDPVTAGTWVMFFHTFGMIGSLVSPLIARGILHRAWPIIVPVISIVGAAGVIFLPGSMLPLWLILCGISSGAGLSVALTFIAERSPSTTVAGAASGMAQSVGYLIAAVGPFLFGWVFELSGAWEVSFIAVAVGVTAQLIAGALLLRPRMVFAAKPA